MTELLPPFMAAGHQKLNLPDGVMFCLIRGIHARAFETLHGYHLSPSFHPITSIFLQKMARLKTPRSKLRRISDCKEFCQLYSLASPAAELRGTRSEFQFKAPPKGAVSKDRGFTLLDLIIVIIILGVLAMMIVPQLGSMANQTKLNSATWELVMAFQYAQTLAIEYQRPFQVKVWIASDRNQFMIKDYTSALDSDEHPDADPPLYTYKRVYNPVDKKPYIIDFDDVQAEIAGEVSTREEYRGVTIDSIPGGGSSANIDFYPDGHSGNSDSVVVMSMGSETRTITVDGFTGKVSVD